MKKHGFSLVEVAIIIIIIALMVTAIIATRNLTDTANLDQIISDLGTYKSDYDSFLEQYSAVPGDMPNANDVFTDDLYVKAGQNINGNGNRIIESDAWDVPLGENFYAWVELVDAKLAVNNFSKELSIFPQGPFGGAYDMVYYDACKFDFQACTRLQVDLQYKYNNSVVFAAPNINYNNNVGGSRLLKGILTPEQIHSIDEKMDDGVANTGIISANEDASVNTNNCFSTDTGAYNLTNTTPECYVIFFLSKNQPN